MILKQAVRIHTEAHHRSIELLNHQLRLLKSFPEPTAENILDGLKNWKDQSLLNSIQMNWWKPMDLCCTMTYEVRNAFHLRYCLI